MGKQIEISGVLLVKINERNETWVSLPTKLKTEALKEKHRDRYFLASETFVFGSGNFKLEITIRKKCKGMKLQCKTMLLIMRNEAWNTLSCS